MTTPPGLRILLLSIGLVAAGSQVACHRKGTAKDQAAVERALGELRSQLAQQNARFRDLRRQVETISPDTPGFPEVRGKFFAVEEARGITDAKAALLADRLASTASAAGQNEQLLKISKEIAETGDEVRQIDELQASLQRQLRAFRAKPGQAEVEAVTSARR